MRLLSYLRQWRRVANEAMQFSVSTAKYFGLLHVTNSYLFSPTLGHGSSMLPTFNCSGDVVLVERVSHRFGRVVPGDVVIVRAHNDPKMMVAKRLLGMKGAKVTFVDPNSIFRHRKTTVVISTPSQDEYMLHMSLFPKTLRCPEDVHFENVL